MPPGRSSGGTASGVSQSSFSDRARSSWRLVADMRNGIENMLAGIEDEQRLLPGQDRYDRLQAVAARADAERSRQRRGDERLARHPGQVDERDGAAELRAGAMRQRQCHGG